MSLWDSLNCDIKMNFIQIKEKHVSYVEIFSDKMQIYVFASSFDLKLHQGSYACVSIRRVLQSPHEFASAEIAENRWKPFVAFTPT